MSDEPPVQSDLGADERPSVGTIRCIAAVTNVSHTELPPLGDSIDADALDALFDHARDADRSGLLEVSFPYAGFDVVVRAGGKLVVRPAADRDGDGTDHATADE